MGILEDDKFIGSSFSSLLGLEVLADGLLQLLFLTVSKVLGDGSLKQPASKLCSADY